MAIFTLGKPIHQAVAWENEMVRGLGWPSTLGMDPPEVDGWLCNNGFTCSCRHTPEALQERPT